MARYASPYCTDEILLDLIQRKDDRAAFAELYDRYWKSLIDMAGRRSLSMEAAEKFDNKANGTAGTRVRKAMQELKIFVTDIRKEISEKKNAK